MDVFATDFRQLLLQPPFETNFPDVILYCVHLRFCIGIKQSEGSKKQRYTLPAIARFI